MAKAAYFPVLNLTGQAGYLSSKADSLFTADSKVWSAAAGISLPVFTGGRTAAQVSQAEAVYQEALSEYRQTVLTAFKEVEDSLAQIVLRNEQAGAQDEAVTSAGRVADLIRVRYDAGTVTYLEVVDADRTLLQQQRLRAQLAGQQFAASVRLIKALGGGWNVSAIPAADNPAGGK